MAQAGPITDVTQRLFVDLKAKSEEVRVKAAYDLYDNVVAISRGEDHKFPSTRALLYFSSVVLLTLFFVSQTGRRKSSSSSIMPSANVSPNSSSRVPTRTRESVVFSRWIA